MVVAGSEQGRTGRLSAELRAFHELARVVASGPYTAGEILDRICSEVRRGFGFERALLVRHDADAGTVHAVVQHNVEWPGDEWLDIERFPFLVQAAAGRRAVQIRDAAAERAVPDAIVGRFGVGSLVAVPLVVEDRCLGFVVADRRGGAERFDVDEQDMQLLSTLGWVAAVFVEKADQYGELEQALADLRRLDEMKTDFVGIASHELRTPIAVVHGIASTLHLRGGELTPEQLAELRRTLFEQTTRLSSLTQGLLDLSRIEAGALRPRPERFRPRERIETLLPQIAPDRLGDVRLAVAPELELVTDADAFERIVANLVTNALRYGRPPIDVRAELGEPLRIVVRDHGDGVEATFVSRLFERFSRGGDDRRREAGAGLGLAIARSYALALNGDLRYEDGRPGACFALVLPASVIAT